MDSVMIRNRTKNMQAKRFIWKYADDERKKGASWYISANVEMTKGKASMILHKPEFPTHWKTIIPPMSAGLFWISTILWTA